MTFPASVTKQNTAGQDILGSLIHVVGREAALIIVENWPGIRVFIPKSSKQGQRLSTVVGIEHAEALSAEFGGLTIKVPMARNWRCHVYFDRGWPNTKIARTLGVSETTVTRIISTLGLSRSRPAKAFPAAVPEVANNILVVAE